LIRLLRFFNTLNFDTAFGAVSFVLVISHFQQVEINISIYCALFISVLSIYNIDHIIDALKLKDTSKSYRHAYYQRHLKLLVAWQVLLLLVGLIILFSIPYLILWAGFALLAIISIYFLVIFSYTKINLMLREVIVAIGYTLAVGLVPFLNGIVQLNFGFLWMLLMVFLIALTNLWTFALYDIDLDNSQSHHSIARSLNLGSLIKMVKGVIVLAFVVILLFAVYFEQWMLGSTLLLVEIVYVVLLKKQLVFRKNDYYRIIGEAILIVPGFISIIYNAI